MDDPGSAVGNHRCGCVKEGTKHCGQLTHVATGYDGIHCVIASIGREKVGEVRVRPGIPRHKFAPAEGFV